MQKFTNYIWGAFFALYFSLAGYTLYELAVHIIPAQHGWMAAIATIIGIIHLGLYVLLVWVLGNILEELDKRNNDKRKPA